MDDDEQPMIRYYTVSAVCQGGPLDGAPIVVPQFEVEGTTPEDARGVLRGVTVTITIDETAHRYMLKPIGDPPFQIYEYRGIPVELPRLELPE